MPPQSTPAASPTLHAWLLGGIIFLAPALGYPGELVLQDTLKSAVVALGTLGAAVVFLWQRHRGAQTVRWHGLVLLPLALMAYAIGSMAWSHTYLAGVEAVRWGILALLLWLGLNTLTRENLPTLLVGIHAGAVVASLWVALQFWWALGWFPQAAPPASTFANRNFFAEYAVSALPFSVLWLAQSPATRWLPARALTVALVVLALLMTGTRSALVTLLVLLPFLAVVAWRFWRQLTCARWGRIHLGAVGTALLAGVLGLGSLPTHNPAIASEGHGTTALQRALARTSSMALPNEYTEGSFSVRASMWKSTARIVMDRPWTGVGAGAWEVQIPLYQGANNSLETDYYAHNETLQLLGEYGLPVGGLFLAVLLATLLLAGGNIWQLGGVCDADADADASTSVWPEGPARAAALASLSALLLVGNAGFPWHLASTGALFMLSLAVLVAADARSVRWGPFAVRSAVALCGVSLALGVHITQQAMQAERAIVGAIQLSNKALRDREPAPPALLLRLREGVAINPHYRKLTILAADQMLRLGDLEGALWATESVVASRPHIPDLWANLVLLHHHFGHRAQAQAAWEELHRLQPEALRTQAMAVLLKQERT